MMRPAQPLPTTVLAHHTAAVPALRRVGAALMLLVLAMMTTPAFANAPSDTRSDTHSDAFDYRLAPRELAPGAYVIVGLKEDFSFTNGGNIVNTGFLVGTEGVIVIDTGPSRRYGEQMLAAIRRVTPLPVVLTLNTHHHPDHFLGNQAFPPATLA